MKNLFIAFGVFALGFVVLSVFPDTELLPAGIRAVLDEVDTVW